MFEAAGFTCRFVRPSLGFTNPDVGMAVGGLGEEVRLTTIERTIADLSDHYVLAGGAEELFNSWTWRCGLAPWRWSGTCARSRMAGAGGFWLEREQKRPGVPDAALEELRTLMPRQPRYVQLAQDPRRA